jgi:hypothetical protein
MPNFLKVNSWNAFVDKLKTTDKNPKDGKINLNPTVNLNTNRIAPQDLSKKLEDGLPHEYIATLNTIANSFNFKSQENLVVSLSPATLSSKGSLASVILIESLDQLDGQDLSISVETLEKLKTSAGKEKLKELLNQQYETRQRTMKPEAKEDLLQLIRLLMQ